MSVFKRWNGAQWETIGPGVTSARFNNINNMIAPEYNPQKTYNIGDYVVQSDKLYRCINRIGTPQAWNDGNWREIKLGQDVTELRNDVVTVSDSQPTSENNRIWVKPDNNEVKIPLVEDVMMLPNPNDYGENDQIPRSTGTGIEWVDYGLPSDQQTENAINAWLDIHPEATTTVQDNSITYEKFAQDVIYKFDLLDDEFLAEGGQYGEVTQEQRIINTQILITLFNKHNGLNFKYKKNIQVYDFSIELQNSSLLCNLSLICFGSNEDAVFYTVGSNKNYIYINNISITNSGGYIYGLQLGSYDNSKFAPYSTLEHILISNFTYPLILFGWNCKIGRIQAYNCKFGVILLGTSIDADALYANNCQFGHCIGVYPDENYEALGNSSNVYLIYSHIGILSVDTSLTCECVIAVGECNRTNVIDIIAYESSTIKYLFNIYSTSNDSKLNVGFISENGYITTGISNQIGNKTLFLSVERMFGEYITTQIGQNSSGIDITLLNDNPYIHERVKKITTFKRELTGTINPILFDKTFSPNKALSVGGSTIGTELNLFLTRGNITGLITYNQTLKIKLKHGTRSSSYSSAIINRQHIFQGFLMIGDADQYNGLKINGTTSINFALDEYNKNGDYSSKLKVSQEITNLIISLDSSDNYPVIIISPTEQRERSNYVFSLDYIGDAIVEIVVN